MSRAKKRSGTGPSPRASAKRAAPRVGDSTRSRIDKLGIGADARVALVGLEDAAFRRELGERTTRITDGRPRSRCDVLLVRVETEGDVARLAGLQKHIEPDGMIWAIWPKGRKPVGEDAIRAAALAGGLVDVKVIAFSATLSGLKLVIPLKRRPPRR